jgi:hypothetical protein
VYNLTEERFVASFENLTLLGFMMDMTRRGIDGGIQDGATNEAGIFTVDP